MSVRRFYEEARDQESMDEQIKKKDWLKTETAPPSEVSGSHFTQEDLEKMRQDYERRFGENNNKLR